LAAPRYEVIFDLDARAEALDAAEYVARTSPRNALRWYTGLEKAIESLEIFPNRCGLAPETEFLHVELRHYIYKSHRVIFRVEESTRRVRILHIRHSKRRAIGEVGWSGEENE
jgi:plasmid stabilization system protein ParE